MLHLPHLIVDLGLILGAAAVTTLIFRKLKQLLVQPHSWFLNRSIRESGIREKAKGIVVGIERKGNRILNPDSDTVFELDDIIRIVGNIRRLQVISNENQPPLAMEATGE